MEQTGLKCVVVGDEAVGKTPLILRYTTDKLLKECKHRECNYEWENDGSADDIWAWGKYDAKMMADGKEYSLVLCDTTGSRDVWEPFKRGFYEGVDVFMMCFNVNDPESFENVNEQWIPEVRRLCPDIPFLVVGTQIDLRPDEDSIRYLLRKQKPVSFQAGKKRAREWGAVTYMECSALTKEGLSDVMDSALNIAMQHKGLKVKPWFEGIVSKYGCGLFS